ncbi:MAG: DUF4382 domain-containing protein [Holophagaceae bacterium]
MSIWRKVILSVVGLSLGWLLGCGSSSGSTGQGTMSVHLVDGPISGYQEVNLDIQAVEIAGEGGWITLGRPNRVLNLLDLVGGVEETLVAGSTLPAGHYGQMRLLLGPANTLKLADGTVQPLKVPSGLQSGVKLVVSFEVAPGTTKDVWIDFDAAHSIQVVQAGASGQYLLRPTVRAYDKVATGSIAGRLTDASSAAGLPGVQVFAETLDMGGAPRIVRSTVTDLAGSYTLDLLPVGATYFVVSQPQVGSGPTSYGAKASDALALTATTPVLLYSGAFAADAAVGAVGGSLLPVAGDTQSDRVNLLQSLATPASGEHTFIVRTTMAAVGVGAESYTFTAVPAGAYSLQAVRTTLNADGTTTSVASSLQPAQVAAGATTTVNLWF